MAEPVDFIALLEGCASSRATVSFGQANLQGSELCSTRHLWEDALKRASALAAITDASSVGIVLEPTRPSVATLLGAWIAGFRVVSIPPPSHLGLSTRLVGISEMESLDVVVANPAEHDALDGSALRIIAFEALANQIGAQRVPSARTTPCLVQYTSGSMSDPAGIELTAEALAMNIGAILEVVDPVISDRPLSWLPLYHDMGLIGMLLSSLVAFGPRFGGGGHLTLLGPETFVRDPRSWLRSCAAERATITAGPTSAFEIAAALPPSRPDLSSLRMVMIGAEPVHAHVVDRFIGTFEPFGFRPQAMCPAYGLAEATLAVSIASPGERLRRAVLVGANESDPGVEAISSGRPLTGVNVRIADAVDGLGRIMVRGPSLLSRYSGNREVPLDADGYLDTNDIGFLRDRELHVVGRADDVIIVGGRNLYPADIEGAVAQALSVPTRSVVAIAVPGGYELVVERRGGLKRTSEEKVRAAIRAAVRPIGATPSAIAIVGPGAIPRTSNGKLRRSDLTPS